MVDPNWESSSEMPPSSGGASPDSAQLCSALGQIDSRQGWGLEKSDRQQDHGPETVTEVKE